MPFQSPKHKNPFHVAHNDASDTDKYRDRKIYEILLFRGYILLEVECCLKMFLQHQEHYRHYRYEVRTFQLKKWGFDAYNIAKRTL